MGDFFLLMGDEKVRAAVVCMGRDCRHRIFFKNTSEGEGQNGCLG